MQIEWKHKWLKFDYEGITIRLQGIQEDFFKIPEVTVNQLSAMEKDEAIWGAVAVYSVDSSSTVVVTPLPAEILELVDQFHDLFAEPSGVPPSRSLTHSIPLVPGTQPFRLRPYRYTPAQKDEIEKQIVQLLKSNMIQESSSPFASPALLVKKKSGE